MRIVAHRAANGSCLKPPPPPRQKNKSYSYSAPPKKSSSPFWETFRIGFLWVCTCSLIGKDATKDPRRPKP